MPRQKREVIFGRGELTRGCLDELRGADGPRTSRQVAEAILSISGQDARDRRLMGEHVKRVSKAVRALKLEGRVRAAKDERGNVVWRDGFAVKFAPGCKNENPAEAGLSMRLSHLLFRRLKVIFAILVAKKPG